MSVITPFPHPRDRRAIATFDRAELQRILDLNAMATLRCTRAVGPHLLARRSGKVINIASYTVAGSGARVVLYTAAKAGQAAFGKVLREEARACGVRVTNLYPGAVDTAIWDDKPTFDRGAMMQADELAGLVVDLLRRPGLAPEEVTVAPPGGSL